VRTVAGLGWPADESVAGPGLGWPADESAAVEAHGEGSPGPTVQPDPGPDAGGVSGVVADEPDPADVPRETDAAPATTDPRETQAAPASTGVPRETGSPDAFPAAVGSRPSAVATVSRETDASPRDGLPDTTTQAVEHARFGPTPAPVPSVRANGSPVTAEEIAADAGAYADPSTPLAAATQQQVRAQASRGLPRPDEPRVFVVANQKGGVGKTTTAVNVAAGLAQHGLRVLIVDLDPQGNASTALGIDHSAGTSGVYEVLTDGTALADVVRPCADVPNLFGVPATIDLAGAEIELVSLVARESRLRRALDALLAAQDDAEGFDYIFIDCPPSLGLLTINALVAGREMLIPIQCEYYALEGVTQLLRNVEMVREHLNPELRVSTIMLTMYDGRTRLASGVADEVRQHFGDLVLRTAIPRSVRISEAPSYGQTVLTYDPASSGALSYLEAARELATHPRPGPQQRSQQREDT
jgi:chromosome partitioning protein